MFQSVYNVLTMVSLVLGMIGTIGTIYSFLQNRCKISLENDSVEYDVLSNGDRVCFIKMQIINKSNQPITITNISAVIGGYVSSCEKNSTIAYENSHAVAPRGTVPASFAKFPLHVFAYGGAPACICCVFPKRIDIQPSKPVRLVMSTSRGKVNLKLQSHYEDLNQRLELQ